MQSLKLTRLVVRTETVTIKSDSPIADVLNEVKRGEHNSLLGDPHNDHILTVKVDTVDAADSVEESVLPPEVRYLSLENNGYGGNYDPDRDSYDAPVMTLDTQSMSLFLGTLYHSQLEDINTCPSVTVERQPDRTLFLISRHFLGDIDINLTVLDNGKILLSEEDGEMTLSIHADPVGNLPKSDLLYPFPEKKSVKG